MSEVRSSRAALGTTIGDYITGEIIITYVEFEENMGQNQKGNLSHRKGGMSEEHEHEGRINANLAPWRNKYIQIQIDRSVGRPGALYSSEC